MASTGWRRRLFSTAFSLASLVGWVVRLLMARLGRPDGHDCNIKAKLRSNLEELRGGELWSVSKQKQFATVRIDKKLELKELIF